MGAVGIKIKIAIVIWALFATLLSGYFSVSMEKRFLDHNPYFFDAVSYSFYNAKLYQRVQDVGRVAVARSELSNNNRHPLRTVPLITFAPSLLAHPFGHMVITLLSLFSFIFLLAYTIYRKTGWFVAAIAGAATPVLLPGLYYPLSGIAAFWLDLTAALLIGSAVLALLNSNNGRSLRWLALFVVFGSCAAFARYVSAAYLLFASAPVFMLYLFMRVREEESWFRSFFLPSLFVTGLGLIIAGPYLFAHVSSVSEFYHSYGYALGGTLESSFQATSDSFNTFIGPAGIMATVLLVASWLFVVVKNKRFDAVDTVVPVWLFLSILVFLIVILRTSAIHTISYAVILVLVALTILWATFAKQQGGTAIKHMGLVALLVLGSGCAGYYRSELASIQNPSPQALDTKMTQTQLADQLAKYDKKIVWNAYFDEIAWIPSMDSFYRHGVLPLPLGQDYVFSIHESVYKGNYPGWSEQRINEELVENANKWLNVAVVFENPEDADRVLTNTSSRSAAKYIAKSIKSDANWVKDFEIDTVLYGRLAGYINMKPKLDNYDLVLAGRANLRPQQ